MLNPYQLSVFSVFQAVYNDSQGYQGYDTQQSRNLLNNSCGGNHARHY